MKTMLIGLVGALLMVGCAAQNAEAPAVNGNWQFDVSALGYHGCMATLTERDGEAGITGLAVGETAIDGNFACADGTMGILGGDRLGDSIDIAVNVYSNSNYAVLLRTTVDVTADTMDGVGFTAHRR